MNLIVLKVEKQRKKMLKQEEFDKKHSLTTKALAELGLDWDNVKNKKLHRLN